MKYQEDSVKFGAYYWRVELNYEEIEWVFADYFEIKDGTLLFYGNVTTEQKGYTVVYKKWRRVSPASGFDGRPLAVAATSNEEDED